MPKLDRYLTGDFLQSFLATLIVLLVVSLGGVLVDVLGNIADGGLPARLMLSQPVSYTHLRAHETVLDLVCRLLLEKKNTTVP